jgi:hypothetical protein
MARKAKKKVEAPPPDADEDQVTDQESIHEGGGGADDVPMDASGDNIPDIIDKTSGDGDEEHDVGDANETTKGKNKKAKKDKKKHQQSTVVPTLPFMDTFYQLSSEESLDDRSIAARDLIQHCFLSEGGVNYKDAAYALTRLMNGLCTGRAASRQGFASCLSSFLRVAHSIVMSGDGDGSVIETMLKEDSGKFNQDGVTHQAMIVRLKLLSTTQFLPNEVKTNSNDKGQKKHGFGGKVKGIEERDHAFGRLFGVSAVVRSGILGLNDFPFEVSSVRLPWWLCCIVWQRYTCICDD